MKETSRISWLRSFQGSRPSTVSSPSYGVRPRIALSAVVLPAPLGPIIPRIRPSSTRKLMPSSAIVVPNALRRPRASMHAIASALLFFCFYFLFGFRPSPGRRPAGYTIQQFFRFQAEPLNGCVDSGPFFAKKLLPFALQQQIACSGIDEHAETSSGFDKPLVHQLLIALQDRERIDPIFSRDIAHGRQGIAFLEHAVEYHRDHTVAKLAVNRLTVIPRTVHQVFQRALAGDIPLSFCALQVEMCMHWLVPRHHISPVLGVVVAVDDSEHGVVHVSTLRATGNIDKIEF